MAASDARDAAPAVRAAVDLCEKVGAELHVARVVRALPPHVYSDKRPEEYEDVYAQQVEDTLGEIARPIGEAGGKAAGAYLRVGDAAREILRLAEEIGAGLIVLGGRDRGPIERLVGGGVREALIARPSIPVLVARGGAGGWPPARVIIWEDSSEGARLAGELAASVGGFYGAGAVLLRVLPGAREAEGRRGDLGQRPLTEWTALLERLGGSRPEVRLVAGDSGKAALDAVAEEAEGGPALLALGAGRLGAAKRFAGPRLAELALGTFGGAVLVGPPRPRDGRDGKRRTLGTDARWRTARPATKRRAR